MSEPLWQQAFAPTDRTGKVLFHLCRWFAVGGGLVLVAIAVMSVASIASRALTGRPLLGDFELVQLGCAVAVASFLPWCQMRRSHVIVDFFTTGLGPRLRAVLDALGALLLAGSAALIAWRMVLGTISLRESGESSMLLAVPTWYAYVPMVPAFVLLALAGLHTAWTELRKEQR
jgi:TRAP-type C4-dicarboxylate transport system permease small subunit